MAEKFAVTVAAIEACVIDVEKLLGLAISAEPFVTVQPVKVYPAAAVAVMVVVEV